MKKSIRPLLAVFLLGGVTLAILLPGSAGSGSGLPGNNVLKHALDVELGKAKLSFPKEQKLSSGAMYAVLDASGELAKRAAGHTGSAPIHAPSTATSGCQKTLSSGGFPDNVRVNQDCSRRRQAEEVIAINPTNGDNLIAGQNDSRVGFNHCGYDWSFDGGETWGDQIPPFYSFINNDGVTFDACSDPTATFDSSGNAYIGGVLFEIFYADSAFLVEKSNNPIGGAFYHTPTPGAFQTYSVGAGVVANDTDPNIFHDKEFIVADATDGPKSDNVYATWTRFDLATGEGVGGHSPIYFSQSTDGGVTWSDGIEISGKSKKKCTDFSGESDNHACDQDQGSHPIVGPDGTIYVAFGNGNTPDLGINQHMIVKCKVIKDCSVKANWMAPVKISDDIGIQPFGPAGATGCPSGRQCLPPNGYRLDDFVEGSVSIADDGKLFFVWADGRNIAANCNPLGDASTATTPCDNDVFYSYSTNGGGSWSSAKKLTPSGSAQWMPWSQVTPDGSRLYVAYYDRSYGSCETSGCNDITLATVTSPATGSPTITPKRITTTSMPNLTPSNNPVQAGFLGDYMWLATNSSNTARIVWADTRGLDSTVEEDIYSATVGP